MPKPRASFALLVLSSLTISASATQKLVHPDSANPSNPFIQSLPDEILEEVGSAHPYMRRLLMDANSTENVTEPTNGTTYSCVSRPEYRSMATRPIQYQTFGPAYQYTDGSFFCEEYVDYAAVCDYLNPDTSCNNKWAKDMYDNFERVLNVYSCKQYSRIWTCKNCKKAYKRWLCSQVYKKYVIPDTDYYEEGKISNRVPRCNCPVPNPNETPEQQALDITQFPHCVRICNGMPDTCTVSSTGLPVDACYKPACGGNGTAAMPGLCQNALYLDPNVASGVNGFYVGAKVEVIQASEPNMQGWWATIEEYHGYTRMAMFNSWNPPATRTDITLVGVEVGDTYRIYLEPSQRGICRAFDNPLRRLGAPCEQSEIYELGSALSTGRPSTPSMDDAMAKCMDGSDYDERRCAAGGGFMSTPEDPLINTYSFPLPGIMGGSRCMDNEKCVKIPQRNDSFPMASPAGYACCPMDGFDITTANIAENRKVHTLVEAGSNVTTGFLNYTCVAQIGSSVEVALGTSSSGLPPAPFEWPPTIANLSVGAVEASGCTRTFVAVPDKAMDDCALKTCRTVCDDVVRRCPVDLGFQCPPANDDREYASNICNIMVPHGCQIQVQTSTSGQTCGELNPTGLGPMDGLYGWWAAKQIGRSRDPVWWFRAAAVYGLPEETTCDGVLGMSINNSNINPPTTSDDLANLQKDPGDVAGSPYGIWCEALDALPAGKLDEEAGRGCREMKYLGFYQSDCGYPVENYPYPIT